MEEKNHIRLMMGRGGTNAAATRGQADYGVKGEGRGSINGLRMGEAGKGEG